MNPLSILGSLPASGSESGKVNSLDYKKIARMAIVMGVSYIAIAVLEKFSLDLGAGGYWFIPENLQAPIMGVLALGLEWLRRRFSGAFPRNPGVPVVDPVVPPTN